MKSKLYLHIVYDVGARSYIDTRYLKTIIKTQYTVDSFTVKFTSHTKCCVKTLKDSKLTTLFQ